MSRMYTPRTKERIAWVDAIRSQWLRYGWPAPQHAAMYEVDITIYLSPRRRGRRPDVDNLVKPILDALTGMAWVDDAEVVTMIVHKRELGADQRDVPGAVIAVRRLTSHDLDHEGSDT